MNGEIWVSGGELCLFKVAWSLESGKSGAYSARICLNAGVRAGVRCTRGAVSPTMIACATPVL